MTRQRRKLIRIVSAIIAVILLSTGALLWILNAEHIIQGDWSTLLPIIFTVIGVIIALLTWLFPISPEQSSEEPHIPLACELARGSFRMGDDSAANFPYITTPIQDAYNIATQCLLDISLNLIVDKQGILILGEANAGKTRLAFEALTKTLPQWPVLRWRPDFTLEKTSQGEIRRNKRLVIFIDDLQDYVPSQRRVGDGKVLISDSRATALLSLIETLFQDVQKVVIVATCRLEDESRVRAEMGQIFAKLTVILLHSFNADSENPEAARVIADFQRHGSSHTDDWDGTLGSLVLGLSTKNSEYLKMQNDPASTVLRAMKLLVKANTLVHKERVLRSVSAGVFGENDLLTDEKTWQESINQLVLKQFVTEEVDESDHELMLVIRKDSYFDQVITDYPPANRPYQLNQDFNRLRNALISLKDTVALVNLGDTLLILKRYQEALGNYDQAIHLDPNLARAYYAKGNALTWLDGDEEALPLYDQAIHLDPNLARAYFEKGKLLTRLSRDEEALPFFDQAIHLDPNLAGAYFEKGKLLTRLKRFQEALDFYDQAIHLNPNLAGVYFEKGNALRWLDGDEEALPLYDQAIHLDPNLAGAYFEKGKLLTRLKRYQEALDIYDQAIHLDPNLANVYYSKGNALRWLDRDEEALPLYDQAIHLDPNLAGAYFEKGKALTRLKRYQEALDIYDQAIHLDPNLANVYLEKGNALTWLDRNEEALPLYDQAIHLDPNLADAYYSKSYTLQKLGNTEEAMQALEKARQLG